MHDLHQVFQVLASTSFWADVTITGLHPLPHLSFYAASRTGEKQAGLEAPTEPANTGKGQ